MAEKKNTGTKKNTENKGTKKTTSTKNTTKKTMFIQKLQVTD